MSRAAFHSCFASQKTCPLGLAALDTRAGGTIDAQVGERCEGRHAAYVRKGGMVRCGQPLTPTSPPVCVRPQANMMSVAQFPIASEPGATALL